MKVSIVTVCLNSEKHIEQTIKSVLNQTYKSIEYIIIDGMSTDNTLNIIEKYKPLFKSNLTVISEKDNGIYNAMNKGIKIATGEIIGIINSDDWYELDAVENVVKCYIENKDSVIYGAMVDRKEDEITKIQIGSYKELGNCMINHPTVFIPKSIYYKFGGFDEKYKIAADYDFMLKLFTNDVDFKFINKVIANFRDGGISTTNIEQCHRESLEIKKKYGFKSELFSMEPEENSQIKFLWDKLLIKLQEKKFNNLYIYGCGMHTKKILNYMPVNIREKINGIIDREVDSENNFFEGYKKFLLDEIEDIADAIIISSLDYEYVIYNRIKHLENKVNIIRIYGADSVKEVNKIISDRVI